MRRAVRVGPIIVCENYLFSFAVFLRRRVPPLLTCVITIWTSAFRSIAVRRPGCMLNLVNYTPTVIFVHIFVLGLVRITAKFRTVDHGTQYRHQSRYVLEIVIRFDGSTLDGEVPVTSHSSFDVDEAFFQRAVVRRWTGEQATYLLRLHRILGHVSGTQYFTLDVYQKSIDG